MTALSQNPSSALWLEHGGSDIKSILAILSVGLGTDEAGTPLADLVAAADQFQGPLDPYEVAARKQGWLIQPDMVNYKHTPGEPSIMHQDPSINDSSYAPMALGWKLVCEENGIEPISEAVHEFLLVDSWLAGRLEKKGEILTEVAGLHIWSRTTSSGQVMPWADPIIEAIASEQAPAADPTPEPF